jgi:hypothetical protein
VHIERVIEETAEAVAGLYDTLDFCDCAGVLLVPISGEAPEDIAPWALQLRAGEITPTVERDGYQEELGAPEVPSAVGQALCDHVADAPDRYVVMERFWLELAQRLRARHGFPVLVCDVDVPIAEQLARQEGVPVVDPLAELEVVVAQRVDDRRTAAVWFDEHQLGCYVASARAPADPVALGFNTELSLDPEIRAGVLPAGAVGVSLQTRAGTWHSAATGRNAWLAVLPQRSGQRDPELRYYAVDGTPFWLSVEAHGLPALWPEQAPARPTRSGSAPDHLTHGAEDWDVTVTGGPGALIDVVLTPILGSVLGHAHGFGLKIDDDGWSAFANCGKFDVEVTGTGEPPQRLDMNRIE